VHDYIRRRGAALLAIALATTEASMVRWVSPSMPETSWRSEPGGDRKWPHRCPSVLSAPDAARRSSTLVVRRERAPFVTSS
jgi:hypothetical protein